MNKTHLLIVLAGAAVGYLAKNRLASVAVASKVYAQGVAAGSK